MVCSEYIPPEPSLTMSIGLATLALGFAAVSVWLAVRIINRREQWTKRLAVVLLLVAAYPISIGPVVWLCSREILPNKLCFEPYLPVLFVEAKLNPTFDGALWKYVRFGCPAKSPLPEVLLLKSRLRWWTD